MGYIVSDCAFACGLAIQRESIRSTWVRYRQTSGSAETQVVRRFQLGRTAQSVTYTTHHSQGLLTLHV